MVMVEQSNPVVPETSTHRPSTTAREYPIWSSKLLPELILRRMGPSSPKRTTGQVAQDRRPEMVRSPVEGLQVMVDSSDGP
jgi:hypothetical protein